MNHARHILSLLLLAAFWLPAQSLPADSVYQVQHQEKVYLHFDNAGYFLRETMWFKAYVLDESNRPTDISRVLYVELVSPEGGVVKTHKCKIEDGMAHGDFYLDSAYLSGFFEVRAYTRHMRNFGEENYFSRVFPVFEEALAGDYGYRAMYDRPRPNLSVSQHKEENAPHGATPLPVKKTIATINRYYAQFKPCPILCDSLPVNIRPGEKIELTFHSTPHSNFSLSVHDADSRIATKYRDGIHHNLFQDNGWVERSYRALSDFDPESEIRYAPETGITVDGDFYHTQPFRGKRTFVPGVAVSFSLSENDLKYGGNMQTDSAGRWSFTLDDFYGERKAVLNAARVDYYWNESRLRMHKWFSPAPRPFTPEDTMQISVFKHQEEIFADSLPESYVDSGNIRHLAPVTVEAQRRRRHWKTLKRSLVHYSFDEEVEYAVDYGIPVGYNGAFDAWHILLTTLGRHFYPLRPTRLMITKDYRDDTIPKGMLYDGPYMAPKDIKEIVIRTDYATCSQYDYAEIGPRNNTVTSQNGSSGMGFRRRSCGVRMEDGYNYKALDHDHLYYLGCFIKYSPGEWEKEKGKYSSAATITPTSRVTVVRGFTRPSDFPAPDYSASREGLENDFRRTLYWNPNVRTDENGIARITFYNNARCRNLHISAEGIGGDGNPVVYQQTN